MVFSFVVKFYDPMHIGVFIRTDSTRVDVKRIESSFSPFDACLVRFFAKFDVLNAQGVPKIIVHRKLGHLTLSAGLAGVNKHLKGFIRWEHHFKIGKSSGFKYPKCRVFYPM